MKQARITFTGARMRVVQPGGTPEGAPDGGTFKLDSTANPKEIDVLGTESRALSLLLNQGQSLFHKAPKHCLLLTARGSGPDSDGLAVLAQQKMVRHAGDVVAHDAMTRLARGLLGKIFRH